MAAFLPLLALAAAAAALRRRGSPFRDAALRSAVGCGVFAAVGAELLGVAGQLTRTGVLALWLLGAAAAALLYARAARAGAAPSTSGRREGADDSWTLIVGVGVVVLLVGLTAWASAPNTWDALTYHLPRVRHWIQDRSLENFPTSNLRQLTLAPGAEILLAQLRLLSDSDRLSNLLQWGAWIGAIAAAASVASRLGGGRTARLAAAAFAASLPMAILQGSSSQNDLVVSFWLLVFADTLLGGAREGPRLSDAWVAGGSLGLAVLTKATALLFGLPLVVWLAAGAIRRRGIRAAAPPLLLCAGIVAVLNAGAWARNVALFGSPLGTAYQTVNRAATPAILISNATRNAAQHLSGPSERWNAGVERAVALVHRPLGIGVEDPRATWEGARFRVPAGLSAAGLPSSDEAVFAMFHDGQAGNPVHLVLLLGAAGVVLARDKLRRSPALPYVAALAAGALLFCLVLRWQPWNSRLELPLFLLGAPLAGVALWDGRNAAWNRMGPLFLLLLALPWALINATRPLLGAASVLTRPRLEQYFAEIPDSGAAFLGAARAASFPDCRRIGLTLRADDPEELIWVCLEAAAPGTRRVEHVGVRNRSAMLSQAPPFAGFVPCAVVALGSAEGSDGDVVFSRTWAAGRIAVRRSTRREGSR